MWVEISEQTELPRNGLGCFGLMGPDLVWCSTEDIPSLGRGFICKDFPCLTRLMI